MHYSFDVLVTPTVRAYLAEEPGRAKVLQEAFSDP
jgi:hypothetical protein